MIVMDAKEAHKTWVIKNPIFPDEGKCEGCYQFKVLCVLCECKKVSIPIVSLGLILHRGVPSEGRVLPPAKMRERGI
jgi:hypothetical protein